MNLRTNAQTSRPSAMAQSLIWLLVIIAFGSFSIIAVLPLGFVQSGKAWSGSFVAQVILQVCLATIATVAFYYALKNSVPFIDGSALVQARFLDTLNAKYTDAAILFSAALSLFIELGIIRWQSSILPFSLFIRISVCWRVLSALGWVMLLPRGIAFRW